MAGKAVYNPATLNRIRQGASAEQLGWDDTFYSRVCRQHGIEPLRKLEPWTEVQAAAHHSGITFNRHTGELQRDGWGVFLTPPQAKLFAALAERNGKLIGGTELREQIGIARLATPGLRRKIQTLRLKIESVRGPHGGLLLVDAATDEPVKITFIDQKNGMKTR